MSKHVTEAVEQKRQELQDSVQAYLCALGTTGDEIAQELELSLEGVRMFFKRRWTYEEIFRVARTWGMYVELEIWEQ